jgi:NAD(P)-dependent dehydrogenase (short-subunit alcohol dehydrogenase family)
VNDIKSAAKEAKRESPKVLPLQLDVTDRKSVEDAAERIKKEFGRLDILINNAGYLESFIPIADSDPLEWWHSWTVNMNGVYLVTRSCLPLLLNTEGGLKTILNVSSIGALRTRPGASAYQTAKLALLRFGQFLNAEYGSQGLLSYGIHPGGVLTELAKGMPKETHAMLMDTPELGAESIVWLTGQRREWLAGRYISVNWDMQEFEGMREEVEKGDLLKVQVTT